MIPLWLTAARHALEGQETLADIYLSAFCICPDHQQNSAGIRAKATSLEAIFIVYD